jgi:hypothetical protein
MDAAGLHGLSCRLAGHDDRRAATDLFAEVLGAAVVGDATATAMPKKPWMIKRGLNGQAITTSRG